MSNARNAKSAREKAAALRAEAERKAARNRALLVALVILLVIGVVVGTTLTIRTLSARANQVPAHQTGGAVAATTANGFAEPVANAQPKVTVEVYEDYLCPICKTFEETNSPTLLTLAKEGKITLTYHPVAILDHASTDAYSTRALNAVAVVLDSSPDSYYQFVQLLFANQPAEGGPGLTDAQLIDYAVQAGADRAAVEEPIRSLRFKGWTQKVTDDFSKRGLKGTPSVIINGKIQEDNSPTALKAALDAALAA